MTMMRQALRKRTISDAHAPVQEVVFLQAGQDQQVIVCFGLAWCALLVLIAHPRPSA